MTEDGGTEDQAGHSAGSTMNYGEGQVVWLTIVSVIAVAALALALVALARVGDDGSADAAPEPGTPGLPAGDSGPVDELEIAATDFAFDPVDALIVADQDVAVALVNGGAVEHNWTVLESGTTIASESEYDEAMAVAAVGDAAGGETVEGSVSLAAGEYQVICTISGHFDAGMAGTVLADG